MILNAIQGFDSIGLRIFWLLIFVFYVYVILHTVIKFARLKKTLIN